MEVEEIWGEERTIQEWTFPIFWVVEGPFKNNTDNSEPREENPSRYW
jgi:hypothetical protein